MNPNAVLARIRAELERIERTTPEDQPLPELANAVSALVDWIDDGGFLPSDWEEVS